MEGRKSVLVTDEWKVNMKGFYKLAVGIPTYKRSAQLLQLIQELIKCELPTSIQGPIEIIVVDNDAEESARKIVENCDDIPNEFKLRYVPYPKKGLSNVRNEIFRQANHLNTSLLACIDDDEVPSKNWLQAFVASKTAHNADVVFGPVHNSFVLKNPPNYMRAFFNRNTFPNGKLLNEFSNTGNVLFDMDFINQHALLFDTRFNTTGGEDTFFGVQVRKAGAKMIWCANAVACETIPESRSRLSWMLKRKFRVANSYTSILWIEKEYGMLLKKSGVSVLNIILGIVCLPLYLFESKYKLLGVLKIAEGVGGLYGLLRIRYHEYKD